MTVQPPTCLSDPGGELAPGVFWLPQSMLGGKVGVVAGSRFALAVDSGNATADGAASAALIRSLGHAPTRLFLTHAHGDHVLGSPAFSNPGRPSAPTTAGADIIAHAAFPATLARHLPNLTTYHNRPNLAAEIPSPTILFSHELTLDLGGKTVLLAHSPGHSPDSAYAFVLEDRILFTGDTAVTNLTPVANHGDTRLLESSLRHLATLDAETLVPGHGPLVHGRENVRAALLWPADYLSSLRTHITSLLKGGTVPEEIVDQCAYDRFVADHFTPTGSRPEKPHQLTAAKILSELT